MMFVCVFIGKRLVKAPKVYLSDSGMVTALLNLHSFDELFGHPGFGALWETIVLANLRGHFPNNEIFFTALRVEQKLTLC
ncbi:MAG: DUF4143 domain-containing protein [Chitinophagales bacterium]|nr:DUF4143 domain-containing protein [Chitinophagales bacterium]